MDDDTGKPINLKEEEQRVLKFLETYGQTAKHQKSDSADQGNGKDNEHGLKLKAKFYIGRIITRLPVGWDALANPETDVSNVGLLDDKTVDISYQT